MGESAQAGLPRAEHLRPIRFSKRRGNSQHEDVVSGPPCLLSLKMKPGRELKGGTHTAVLNILDARSLACDGGGGKPERDVRLWGTLA